MQMTATKHNVLDLFGVEDQMWILLGRARKPCPPEGDEGCFPLQDTVVIFLVCVSYCPLTTSSAKMNYYKL